MFFRNVSIDASTSFSFLFPALLASRGSSAISTSHDSARAPGVRREPKLQFPFVNPGAKTKKSGRNAHFSGGFEPPLRRRGFAYPGYTAPIDPKSSAHEAETTPRARAN
jgi:hypothetical protein